MSEQIRVDQLPVAVWWLLGGALVLIAFTAVRSVAAEEQDLSERAVAALDQAGLDLDVSFEGRDASLSGVVTNAVDIYRAETLIGDLRGVRIVDLSGVRMAIPNRPDPWLELDFNGTTSALSGSLPTLARVDELVEASGELFGATNVAVDVSVDPSAEDPSWLDTLSEVFVGLNGWRSGTLAISAEGVVITGVVDTAAAGERIAEHLSSSTEINVDYSFDVIGNRTPSFDASADGDSIRLNGELASRSSVDAVMTAVEGNYSAVENNLVVAGVQAPPWAEALPELIFSVGTWDKWQAEIVGGSGTFSGLGPSSAEVAKLKNRVLPNLGIDWDDSSVEVDPNALAAELTSAVAGTITFETASAILDDESTNVLDGVADALLANPSTRVIVEGHTDSQGSEDVNLTLSENRAQTVVDYLINAGVAADRLSAAGFGESRPVAENGTPIGRAQNRRIEFVVPAEEGDR